MSTPSLRFVLASAVLLPFLVAFVDRLSLSSTLSRSDANVQRRSLEESAKKKIWLPGATGSGPYDVAYAWTAAFQAKYPEVEVTLSSVGSGAAQAALRGDIDCVDKPVDAICEQSEVKETLWGLGDAPIGAKFYEDNPSLKVQQFPACAGAVPIVYSKEVSAKLKPGSEEEDSQIRMTFDALSAIFNTSIVYWDDLRLQALNPHLELPHQRISKVVRRDSSGQTSIVTDALDFQVASWPDEAVGKLPNWPMGELADPTQLLSSQTCVADAVGSNDVTTANSTVQNGRRDAFAGDGKNGVSLGLIRVPYSLGYMEKGLFVRLTDFLEQVRIGSLEAFAEASEDSIRTTMAGLSDQLNPDTLELNLARADTPTGGFPIAGYAYWYLKRNPAAFSDCYQAWLLCKFVEWSYVDPQASDLAIANGWVVPPENVVEKTLEKLNTVMCFNTEVNPPVAIPALSYTPPPYRPEKEEVDLTMIITVAVSGFLIVAVLLLWAIDRHRKNGDHIWRIKKKDLDFGDTPEVIGRGKFGVVLLANYRGTQVAVKRAIPPSNTIGSGSKGPSSLVTGTTLQYGKCSAESALSSESGYKTNSREGLASSLSGKVLTSGGSRRTSTSVKKMIKDFVQEMRYLSRLRHPCVTTIMGAVMEGDPMLVMEYMDHGSLYNILHNETMVFEGGMRISVLRDISQGVRFLHSAEPQIIHGDLKSANILVDSKFRAKVADFGLSPKGHLGTGTPFWMAPELLRGESANTTATDVYSFGIILYEVYARKDPYDDETDSRQVLRLVADKAIQKRPPVPKAMPDKVKALMGDCLEEESSKRPTFEEMDMRLKRIDEENEDSVPSTGQLSLFDIFPQHIAEKLQRGQKVDPEHKESVTIFFCDIVGFTTMSSYLEPRKVANMLDRLYTKFDALSHKHGIFKVETIGDAYMAVTNLVKNQEEDHAKRIAYFAIEAIAAANDTYIDPEDLSKGCVHIRVGFHSGPVVADVVGTRNQRYCLFGDTVNISSRMESNSAADRINCSEEAAKLLHKQCPDLPLKSRGVIQVKGKGGMKCYWVNEGDGLRSSFNRKQPNNTSLEPLIEASKDFSSHEFGMPDASFSKTTTRQSPSSSMRSSHEFELMEEQCPEAGPSENSDHQSTTKLLGGAFTQLIDKGQQWLRLKEEIIYDDEVSV